MPDASKPSVRAPLTADAIRESSHIVAMMGAEPISNALDAGEDVVLAGRSIDPAIFPANPLSLSVAAGRLSTPPRASTKGTWPPETLWVPTHHAIRWPGAMNLQIYWIRTTVRRLVIPYHQRWDMASTPIANR